MKKIKTGDKSLDKWINFFTNEKKSNTKFLKLLTKNDKFFLTVSPPQYTGDTDFPEYGLLEDDFRQVAFNNSPELLEEKNRLILALSQNVNFTPWVEKYHIKFFEAIERSFVEGDYEKYGIVFEKVLKIAIDKEYIDRSNFIDIALLRGMLWSSRYDTKEKEAHLKKTIKINHYKVLLGI